MYTAIRCVQRGDVIDVYVCVCTHIYVYLCQSGLYHALTYHTETSGFVRVNGGGGGDKRDYVGTM